MPSTEIDLALGPGSVFAARDIQGNDGKLTDIFGSLIFPARQQRGGTI